MDIVENIANAIGWAIFYVGVSSCVGLTILAILGLFSPKNKHR